MHAAGVPFDDVDGVVGSMFARTGVGISAPVREATSATFTDVRDSYENTNSTFRIPEPTTSMPSPFVLSHRLATPADLDAVHAIYVDTRVVPYLGFDPMSRAAFVPVFGQLVSSGGFHLVEAEGGIVGFYHVTRQAGRARHVATLGTFAVAPEAQGRGVGMAILEAVIARLHADGVARIELTLEADNPRALALYRKLGFEHEGTLRAAYQRAGEPNFIDQWLMAKVSRPPE